METLCDQLLRCLLLLYQICKLQGLLNVDQKVADTFNSFAFLLAKSKICDELHLLLDDDDDNKNCCYRLEWNKMLIGETKVFLCKHILYYKTRKTQITHLFYYLYIVI